MEKRRFKKLRISLTNQCNLACNYCVPHNLYTGSNTPDIISVSGEDLSTELRRLGSDELNTLAATLHQLLNFTEVRLTGGEPLLYPKICNHIKALKNTGIAKIGLTSNGFLLPMLAKPLKESGLNNVNVSLDAISPEIFRQITRKNYLNKVVEGIDAAINTGLSVKINAVIMHGINTSEILPLLEFAKQRNITIRFIELMKMGHLYESDTTLFFPAQEILAQIEKHHPISELLRKPSSTARYWETDTGQKFGIIANEAFPFCSDCNRLRLDEYGRIFGCISSKEGFLATPHINNSEKLKYLLKKALKTKQAVRFAGSPRTMIGLGG